MAATDYLDATATQAPTGDELITRARMAQLSAGHDAESDQRHRIDQLSNVAWCYLGLMWDDDHTEPAEWPEEFAWEPSHDMIENLVRAGAFIAAEIDRRLQEVTP